MYCPVVLMLSASTFSAALLLLPRSSPEGVAVGVGVGVGRGAASAAGETAEQASASAMKAGPKWFRSRRSEVLICVFMGVIPFLFGFSCVFLTFATHSRKFGMKFPKIFSGTEFLNPPSRRRRRGGRRITRLRARLRRAGAD